MSGKEDVIGAVPDMARIWSEYGANMARIWTEYGPNMERKWPVVIEIQRGGRAISGGGSHQRPNLAIWPPPRRTSLDVKYGNVS